MGDQYKWLLRASADGFEVFKRIEGRIFVDVGVDSKYTLMGECKCVPVR